MGSGPCEVLREEMGRNALHGPGQLSPGHTSEQWFLLLHPLTWHFLIQVSVMIEQKWVKSSLLISSKYFSKPSLMSDLESVFPFLFSLAFFACLCLVYYLI